MPAAHRGSSSNGASDGTEDDPEAPISSTAASSSVPSPSFEETRVARSSLAAPSSVGSGVFPGAQYRSLTSTGRSAPASVPTSTALRSFAAIERSIAGSDRFAYAAGSRHAQIVPSAPPVTSAPPANRRSVTNARHVAASPCPAHRPTSAPVLASYTRTTLSTWDTAASAPVSSTATQTASPAPSSAQGNARVGFPVPVDQTRSRPSAPAVAHVRPPAHTSTP
mmetsp:Transcript_4867/g.21694  ORF Transcript_4867/g.21694 Transcript_4867/m.21694 type:complete len:223 (-) Transcript_4867:2475-3143(-)